MVEANLEAIVKLIEKLAKEFSDPEFINEFEGYGIGPEEAFMAGFRKAREMAAQCAINHPNEKDSDPFGFCNTCGGGPEIAKSIYKVGEEEAQ